MIFAAKTFRRLNELFGRFDYVGIDFGSQLI
jgi:hypothetical protein